MAFVALVRRISNSCGLLDSVSTRYMTVALERRPTLSRFSSCHPCVFQGAAFLAADSVIIAMPGWICAHERIAQGHAGTVYLTCVIGSLALAGIPPLQDSSQRMPLSKRSIIPQRLGRICVCRVDGVVLTAFYSFRLVYDVSWRGAHGFNDSRTSA